MLKALIVDDDDAGRVALAEWLEEQGVACRQAEDLAKGRAALDEELPDLVLLDLELPDGNGLELLETLGASQDCETVLISGTATVDAVIEALRLGARDVLTKPVDLDRLGTLVGKVARKAELRSEVATLRSELRKLGRFGEMVGVSAPMQTVYDALERVAPTDETVFVTGETGTGKELVASTLHRLSRRHRGPFLAVNCGAVPENLMESEFFGHERGAFTGADKRRKGLFERATGGTLFLDEVTEMPVDLQVRLLRVLETSQVTRVGGTDVLDVDVRIVAASNRVPAEAVEEGKLRQDLLYRLLVFEVQLPPLRERGDDVVLLARTFLDRLNAEHETSKTFSEPALAALAAHDWPGNVRELDNAVRRAFVMAEAHVEEEHLPLGAYEAAGLASPTRPATGSASGPAKGAAAGEGVVVKPGMSIADAEQALIEATLEELDGDKKAAAEQLGISLKTLYARLKVYKAARGED